jgi:hypothetical protein
MNTSSVELYRYIPKPLVDALDIYFPKPLVDHILSYITTPHTFKEGDIHYISYRDGWGYVRFDRVIIGKIRPDYCRINHPTVVEYFISNFIFDYGHSGSEWGYPVGPLKADIQVIQKQCRMSTMKIRTKDIRGLHLPTPLLLYSLHTKDETKAFNIMLDRMFSTSIIRLSKIKDYIIQYCFKNNLLDVKLLR